jgi:hypothetical protein
MTDQPSEDRVSLPSIKLKSGQMACCPDCKQLQSDQVEDYLPPTKDTMNDRCEGCGIGLRFLRTAPDEYEVHARYTQAELQEMRRTLG